MISLKCKICGQRVQGYVGKIHKGIHSFAVLHVTDPTNHGHQVFDPDWGFISGPAFFFLREENFSTDDIALAFLEDL